MAMSGTLLVTPQKLTTAANNFYNSSRKVKSYTDQMMSLVTSTMKSSWRGGGATEFITKFSKLQTDMNQMYKMIWDYYDDLTDMVRNYQTAEQNVTSVLSGLQTDVIQY